MRIKLIIILSVLIAFSLACTVFARGRRNDDFIREYPDGNYGLDLGGGYEVAPLNGGVGDEELLLPQGYREDYRNTKYGPMTQKGFQLFPDFHFSDSSPAPETTSDFTTDAHIFSEHTTSTENSLWGVYDPSRDK